MVDLYRGGVRFETWSKKCLPLLRFYWLPQCLSAISHNVAKHNYFSDRS